MKEIFHQIVTLNAEHLALILMVCLLGFALMKTMAPIAGLAYVTFPFMIAFALLAHSLMLDLPVVVQLEKGAGLVLTTCVGMATAVIVVVSVVRIGMVLHDLLGKQPDLIEKELTGKRD